eukprot:2909874-Amphidinium_carterae.1
MLAPAVQLYRSLLSLLLEEGHLDDSHSETAAIIAIDPSKGRKNPSVLLDSWTTTQIEVSTYGCQMRSLCCHKLGVNHGRKATEEGGATAAIKATC